MNRLTSFLRMLRPVRTTPAPELSAKITALRASFEEARQSVQHWKARAGQLAALLHDASSRQAAAARAAKEAVAHAQTWRHEVPVRMAVQSRFPHRLRTFESRTRIVPPAQREAQLIEASAPYRARLDAGVASLDGRAERMRLEGLTWWVPVRTTAKGKTPKPIRRQRLPYHGIMLTRELAIGGVMLDLGAHIGRMSIPRVILGDVTAAYCAEPDPVNYACLVGNVTENGLRGIVLPDQTAIGDVNGVAHLVRAGGPSGFYVTADPAAHENVVEVPCTTLDTWVERLRIDLDAVTFIKVDVEGFEQRLLRGAGKVLACRHIAWQIEVNPVKLRGNGDDPRSLYADLRQAFTHFIDLNRRIGGPRVRPVAQLGDALAYIDPDGKTDVLLYAS